MSLAATVRALVTAGATPEMILAVVETHERETADALARRRASDAARQQAHRDRVAMTVEPSSSRDVTLSVCDSRDPLPHVGERAQVVTPSLPSLRSEEVREPVSSNEDTTPLKPKFAKPNGFARFWEAYPNKVGKAAAETAFAKAIKRVSGPDPPGELLAGVERAKASRAWAEGYIPHPATWLKQGRWEDEPSEIAPRDGNERPHPYQPAPSGRAAKRGVWAEIIEQERRSGAGGPAGTG